ncbi:Taurine hydroxylase-like protein SAT17 [Pseudocercospora fuligena]|uniref:Taurine hydroxylase-like protein SAT17 n=1 Tax=Pseudocercospora fuligena TaxID=685502 RepID=A0A8H6RVN0_9PEZI|nr:Taurine hydroxylase-like protein SAT17 [Pseudocercospora fuligena]
MAGVSSAGTSSSSKPVRRDSVFPDGLKTSGQHPPIYDLLRPYEDFPKEVTGQTIWSADDYKDNPERWTYVLSNEEITELSLAADRFIETGTPLTGISNDHFPLPKLGPFLLTVRHEFLNGKGFVLLKGLPVEEWGLHKSAVAYMGLGSYFGYFVSQNGRGHILGHVKDLGEDPSQEDKVRIYRTNAKQYFHTDSADLVGLLCIAKALEGGESDIVSTHNVFTTLQRERPDVVKALVTPDWYFDRKGEVSNGQEPWYKSAIMFLENDPNGRVWAKIDPNNVTSLARYSTGPDAKIPPLSKTQQEALRVLEGTCTRLALHLILDPGDIELLSNAHVLHARTAYKDHPPGSIDDQGRPRFRRHLMRLWLAVPEDEGGWKLAFHDVNEKKRGGIQVNDNAPVAHDDAE